MNETPLSAPAPLDPARKRRFYLYLTPILLFPILLFVAAFFIIPSNWFVGRSGSTYLVNFAYADTLRNRNCQVLIFGDSSAMVGVDPALLTARTGLSACNIAEFEGMTLVTGTLLVDRFLARNPAPRYLVFLYTPEDLNMPNTWDRVSTFEATSWVVRNDLNPHTVRLLAAHPANTFGWAEQGLRMTAQRLHSKPYGPEVSQIRPLAGGQLHMSGHTLNNCDGVPKPVAPDLTWISKLRTRYTTASTQVLVDATPPSPATPASLSTSSASTDPSTTTPTEPSPWIPLPTTAASTPISSEPPASPK